MVVSTSERIDVLPSFVFVCPSNCGSRSFTDTIPTSPSRRSSPIRLSSFSFRSPLPRACRLSTFVRAFLNPSSCMPPSWVLIVFANECSDSAYPAFHCKATSTLADPSLSLPSKWMTRL